MNSTGNWKRDRGTGSGKANAKRLARSVKAGSGGWGAEELERRVLLLGASAALGDPVTTPTRGGPVQVVLADMNQDGKLDAVTADNTGHVAGVFLNNAGQLPAEAWTAFAERPMAVGVADVMGY